jgi:hypothetical protein
VWQFYYHVFNFISFFLDLIYYYYYYYYKVQK